MRFSVLAATIAALLVVAGARAQPAPPDPPICNGSLRAWSDLAGGGDLAAMQRLYANTLPACRDLRARMGRAITALRQPHPNTTTSTPLTTSTATSTTTATTSPPAPPRRIVEFDDCNGAPWCPRMVVVPGGAFTMGSPESEPGHTDDESPRRRTGIGEFAASKFEITFNQWGACVSRGGCRGNPNPNDQGFGRGERPVINVTWEDANDYTRWLSNQTHQHYRLLSEAEWEYAARAGSTSAFWTGATIDTAQANFNSRRTQVVGSYRPNRFGLFDTAGNAWEWVEDCPTRSYADNATHDGEHQSNCRARDYRGGAYYTGIEALRSANRSSKAPNDRGQAMGFRVARDR